MRSIPVRLVALTAFAGLAACVSAPEPTLSVPVSAETARVGGGGDAADDPAILPGAGEGGFVILGTDKTAGLYVFDAKGAVRQTIASGRLNNVDLRPGFSVEGETKALAIASNRTTNTLDLYLIDPATGAVEQPPESAIPLDLDEPYGVCLHRTTDSRFLAGVTGKDGAFRQFEIVYRDKGFDAVEVRRFELGSITEGCVVDDRTGALYLGEETVGLWRYGADPATGAERVSIAAVDGRRLVEDIEGVAIYAEGKDAGWLVVSSQGDDAYGVFELPSHDYLGRFRLVEANGVDATSETDGIEITAAPLPGYPEGVLIVQDDEDDRGGQNFKIVDWRAVRAALEAAAPQPTE